MTISKWAARLVSLLLIVLMAAPAAVFAEENAASGKQKRVKLKPVKTYIKGFKTRYHRRYKSAIRDTVTVTPAYGRTLLLKRYDKFSKKWVLEKKIKTKNKWKDRVSFWYTNAWRATPKSSWILVAPRTRQRKRNGKWIAPAKRIVKHSKIRVYKFHHAGHAVILDAETGVPLCLRSDYADLMRER